MVTPHRTYQDDPLGLQVYHKRPPLKKAPRMREHSQGAEDIKGGWPTVILHGPERVFEKVLRTFSNTL